MKKIFFLVLFWFAAFVQTQACETGFTFYLQCQDAIFYLNPNTPPIPGDSIYWWNYDIKSVTWDYGDGNAQSLNGTEGTYAYHTYTQDGTYNACATVTDSSDCVASFCSQVVIDAQDACFYDFYTYGSYSGQPNTYTFTSYAYSCSVLSDSTVYTWDYGDGTSESYSGYYYTFQHVYLTEGEYTACCTVSSSNGLCSEQKCLTVLNFNEMPENCSLTIQAYSQYGSTFNFYTYPVCENADSIVTPYVSYTYSWDFGNGQTSTLEYNTVTYAEIGSYNVCVTATSNFGTVETICQTIEVTELTPECVLGFDVVQNGGNTYTFTANIDSSCLNNNQGGYFYWIDGYNYYNAFEPSITVTYPTAGYYYVCLNYQNAQNFYDYVCQTIEVGDADCSVSFVSNMVTPNTYQLTSSIGANCDPNYTWTYSWDLGNGQASAEANPLVTFENDSMGYGYQYVCLYATNNEGNTYSYCSYVYLYNEYPENCEISFSSYTYDGKNFSFYANNYMPCFYLFSNWVYNWDFGDGSTYTSTNPYDSYIQHTYTTFEEQNVCLTAINTFNNDTLTYCATVTPQSCYLYNYAYAYPSYNVIGEYYFYNGYYQNDTIYQNYAFAWDFGDGSTSTEINPLHAYTQNGTYTVCSTISANDTCTNTTCFDLQVDVDGPLSCTHSIQSYEFGGGMYSFYANLTCTDSSDYFYMQYYNYWTYSWDFGNGQTSTDVYPNAFFDQSGTYNVCLTTTSTLDGSTATTCTTVTVNTVQYDCSVYYDYAINSDYSLTFYPAIAGACSWNGINLIDWQFDWTFGNGETSSEVTPTVTFSDQNEVYEVCLNATNLNNGITSQYCGIVTVIDQNTPNDSTTCTALYYASTQDSYTYTLYPLTFGNCPNFFPFLYLWDVNADGNYTESPEATVTLGDSETREVCMLAIDMFTFDTIQYCKTLTGGSGLVGGSVFKVMPNNETEPMPNVVLNLLNQQHQVIETITTNAEGKYNFSNLNPSNYYVVAQMPDMIAQEKQVTLTETDNHNNKVNFIVTNNIIVTDETFTAVKNTTKPSTITQVQLYPNPTLQNATLQLQMAQSTNNALITIHDIVGKKMFETTQNLTAGSNTLELPTATLPKGMYIVNLKTQNNETQNLKLVKQ